MDITLNAQTIITAGSVLTALALLWKYARKIGDFVQRQKRQDEELTAIRGELTVICYGLKACLQGLAEQGCDGPVHEALDRLDKHLNKAAHGPRGEQ